MSEEQHILDDYMETPAERSRVYLLLLISGAIYFLFFIIQLFLDPETFSVKTSPVKWEFIVVSLVIPGLGFSLMIARKKAGWFISTLYFSFIAFASILFTVTEAIKTSYNPPGRRQTFTFALFFTLTILLLSRAIRKRFNIKMWWTIYTIVIVVSLGLLLFFLD